MRYFEKNYRRKFQKVSSFGTLDWKSKLCLVIIALWRLLESQI